MSKEDIEMSRPEQLKQLLIHMRDIPPNLRDRDGIYQLCAQAIKEMQTENSSILTKLDMGTQNPFLSSFESKQILLKRIQSDGQRYKSFHKQTASRRMAETLGDPLCTHEQYFFILSQHVSDFNVGDAQDITQGLKKACQIYHQSIQAAQFTAQICFFGADEMKKRIQQTNFFQRNGDAILHTALGLVAVALTLLITIGGLAALGVSHPDPDLDLMVRLMVGEIGAMVGLTCTIIGIVLLVNDAPSTKAHLANLRGQKLEALAEKESTEVFWKNMQQISPQIEYISSFAETDVLEQKSIASMNA